LGQWDEAMTTASRAERVWKDLDRSAASYGVGTFLAALHISRARQDADAESKWRDVVVAILGNVSSRVALITLNLLVARGDLAGAAAQLAIIQRTAFPLYVAEAIDGCTDHTVVVARDVLQRWMDLAIARHMPLLEASARRAIGVANGDADALRRSLELFESSRAVPLAARVRCELGSMTGDDELVRSGTAALESLGDVDQLERYAVTRR
jgi:hypothetical protein